VVLLCCDDLCTESDDEFEYADSRLEMDESRFNRTGVLSGWESGICIGSAFLCIGFACFGASGSDETAGSAGRGELSGFASRGPTLSVLGGNAIVVDISGRAGRAGSSRGDCLVANTELSFQADGGAGNAFENRERPDLGVCRDVDSIILPIEGES
jgi:hypothetical protein